ncbi:MAG: DNA-3-methyladenine glycosylase 2 family protein [Actinobacteria bacterium]|nr:DNA-3-methyladenine glycosylase 2 family protein [Actinomycetota bacterium]
MPDEQCYRAVQSRDSRFDGWFVVAVHTTGIYCRPSCPAKTPHRHNVSFFRTAATAQQRGFRACKRCRPDASPGSPEWNVRADVVARAMRLIADGVVDRSGVGGLATRLGYSERHLNRLITDELGAGPLAIARAQRAQTARVLIETTDMTMTDVAFAAGFASVRQFNDTVHQVFATAPTELRAQRRRREPRRAAGHAAPGSISVRLPLRVPFDPRSVFASIGTRAVPGVESWDGEVYRRSLRLPNGSGTVALRPDDAGVSCTLWLDELADLQTAVQRCRRLLDLDADPVAIDQHLGTDPMLARLVARRPGLRSPGCVDGTELLVRAIIGQQVSVAGAATVAGRLARLVDDRTDRSGHESVQLLFPSAQQIAALDPATLPMPRARGRSLVGAAAAVAGGLIDVDLGADRDELTAGLLALPGVGPWTAQYVAMRALGDPDVFMPTDLGVTHALRRLGADASPRAAAELAKRFTPWRSYALHHLWHSLSDTSHDTVTDTGSTAC